MTPEILSPLANFIARNRIKMTASRVDSNPSMPDSDDIDHWRCVLTRDKRVMTVPFSMGDGYNGAKPTVDTVLDCLASDASGADETFEYWCGNFGYDTDSRRAEKTYKAVQRQTAKLRAFLGEDLYMGLLGLERI